MRVGDLLRQNPRTAIEEYCRARARSVPCEGSTVLCRVLGEHLMYVDMADRSLAPHLAMEGYWESWIAMALAGYVQPGMRCVDVGANFGFFTLLCADLVEAHGHVWAWEPQSTLCGLLVDSVGVNGFAQRVTIVPHAASAREGTGALVTSGDYWGSTMFAPGDGAVGCRALDAVVEPPVHLLKIDAEGHEPEVWSGAERLIADSPGIVVLLEFTPGRYRDPAAFLDVVEGAGFRLRKVGTDGRPAPLERAAALAAPGFEMLWLAR